MTPIIDSLDDIASRYDVLFCDLWGCLHNGVRVFPAAAAALRRFRQGGGTVVLLTNAPRPFGEVATQVESLGGAADLYDAICSSGDAAQSALAAGQFGTRVHHIGPPRDLPFFDIAHIAGAITPVLTPLDAAEGVVCTGLFDDEAETPETYRDTLFEAKARGLKLLCANPDIVVDRGDSRLYCAGALAALFTELGGESRYFGKPHSPIYDLARDRAAEARGEEVEDARILCIGDGVATDLAGAVGEGLDVLYVTGGLDATRFGDDPERPERAPLDGFLAGRGLTATAAIGRLR